jgi:hypothetical protein
MLEVSDRDVKVAISNYLDKERQSEEKFCDVIHSSQKHNINSLVKKHTKSSYK